MAEKVLQRKRLIRNSVLNLVNQGITMVVTFATSIIVARTLKPEAYGIFNLVLWFTGLITWAVGMGLINAVTKYVSEYRGRGEPETAEKILSFVLRVELVLSLALTIVLLVFRLPIADYFFSDYQAFYFLIAAFGLLPGILTAVFSAAIEGLQKFEHFTRFHLIVTPLAFLAKIAVLLLGYRIEGLLTVTLFFSFVNTFFFYRILRKEGLNLKLFGPVTPKELKARILRYNRSVSAIQLSDKIVWDKSENFFLGRLCSAEQIGFYNLAYNVSSRFMNILPSTLWRVLFPAMSEYFGSGEKERMRRLFYLSTRYIAFVSFPVGIAGIVLAFPTIKYLYGRDFLEAKTAMQILFGALIISSLSKPGSAILYGTERQGFIFRFGMILAAVNLVLDFILIHRFGAVGAAIACGTVMVLGSTIGLIYTCHTMDLQYPFRSLSKIALSAILMGVVMMLIMGRLQEPFGFIFAMLAGIVVYFSSATAMGGFESEDYHLLASIKAILPERWKPAADHAIRFFQQFKSPESCP